MKVFTFLKVSGISKEHEKFLIEFKCREYVTIKDKQIYTCS